MFGYVRLYKPEIKMGEYEQYQGIYCTLCRRLGKLYGVFARMTLSYDMTFLALLNLALDGGCSGFRPGRCSFNPTKRCLKCEQTDAVDFAADVGMLLSYHKIRDTMADEGFWKKTGAAILLPYAAVKRKKAASRQPELDKAVSETMQMQAAMERERTASVDRAAEPFALLLQRLAAFHATDDRQRRILERFGYCLGRWIYLVDATDDLEEDLKNGSYNPYASSRSLMVGDAAALTETRQYAVQSLNACLAECISAYNLLSVPHFDGILRNILEQGMPARQRLAASGERNGHKHE